MHIVEQSHPYWKEMSGFSKLLFPTDFSEAANHALENALCLTGVREVIVQHVVSSYFEKHPHWSTLFDIHEMQKYMDMYIETEMAKVPIRAEGSIRYRTVISEGKPASQITEVAEKEKVDLIVMGPAHGVITGSVIRAANRPVLAIPHSDSLLRPLQAISRILVTTDLSPYSKMVVDYAFRLRQFINCDLILLYVIELSSGIKFGVRQGYFSDAVSKARSWAILQLENLTPAQFVNDNSVHRLVEEGEVSAKITECADVYDVNLVIVGSHGYSPVEKYFLGTTTDKLLTKLSRPVLVVKT
jgi:nucleotide-binding universal stress UspA family protein